MATLTEVIEDEEHRRAVVADGVRLVEQEVARKRGLSGMAIKAGFKTVNKLQPSFVERALDHLLPDFAPAVDPHFAEARASGDVEAFFTEHAGEIADSLLAVTDARARRAKNRALVAVYQRLRPRARVQVIEAMPGLARLVTKHVP